MKEDGAEKDYVVLDVVDSYNDHVLGLVIEVSDRALRSIDRREGVSVGAYERKTVSVSLSEEMVEAIVYSVVNKEVSGTPIFFLYRKKEKHYHIDYFFCEKEKVNSLKIGVFDDWILLSDHMPVTIDTNITF